MKLLIPRRRVWTIYVLIVLSVGLLWYSLRAGGDPWSRSGIAAVDSPISKRLMELEDVVDQMSAMNEHLLHKSKDPFHRPQLASVSSVIPVLVLACNRPAIKRCIDKILEVLPPTYPLIVSHDCDHAETEQVIRSYEGKLHYIRQPDRSQPQVDKGHDGFVNYYRISRHYRWALGVVFDELKYDQAIVLEDDMEISVDFFEYFSAFLPLLKADKSVMCISSWNDNGKAELVADPESFYRSDFFPGLGWMLTRDLWRELEPKWPKAFWDDWLRLPEQRMDRSCIRPEISRTLNFGQRGVSNGQYYEEHIRTVVINTRHVQYSSSEEPGVDVMRFKKDTYDAVFSRQVYNYAQEVSSDQLKELLSSASPHSLAVYADNQNAIQQKKANVPDINSEFSCGRSCMRRYRLSYKRDDTADWTDFVSVAARWNLMTDIRAGQARTAYKGIVCWKAPFANIPPPVDGKIETHVEICLSPSIAA